MKKLFLSLCMLGVAFTVSAQYITPMYYKLLDDKNYDLIVGESSGEQAIRSIYDLAPYEKSQRNFDSLFEAVYIRDKAEEYGLEGVVINRYPKEKPTWSGVKGTLWEVAPYTRKLADFNDLPAVLAQGSDDADVTAELVWVGDATDKELDGIDLQGKIALGSANVNVLHKNTMKRGAVGVISFYSPRPLVDPLQIPNASIRVSEGEPLGFGFLLTPRDGYVLRDRLKKGEKVTVHAVVEAKQVDFEYQSPSCYISGTDPDAGEILFSAHLFEGYSKLGANDNISGSAVLLEVARTLNTLIKEGKIERPRRTLRFVWGDEFSGIIPWANANKDITGKALFDINLDMVGLALAEERSYYCLHRTTMANSHYVNDIAENILRYVGSTTNRQSILLGTSPKPVVAPTGSDDPFYYSLVAHYGASDHEVFNDWGVQVPAILMVTWPDNHYHTSADRVEYLDPTQLKRAVVVTAAIAYIAATADEEGALQIGGEVSGNALRRIASIQNVGADKIMVEKANKADSTLKKVLFDLDATALAEKMTLESVKELAPESEKLERFIETQKAIIEKQVKNAQDAVVALSNSRFGTNNSLSGYRLNAIEKRASKMYPKSTAKVREKGYNVLNVFMQELGKEEVQKYNLLNVQDKKEAARLTISGDLSVLDIKKMVDVQNRKISSLEDMITFMELLSELGYVEIRTEK